MMVDYGISPSFRDAAIDLHDLVLLDQRRELLAQSLDCQESFLACLCREAFDETVFVGNDAALFGDVSWA